MTSHYIIIPGEGGQAMLGPIVEDVIYFLLGANSHKWDRDDDDDGIPNCDDPDYVPPEDGDGTKWKGGR